MRRREIFQGFIFSPLMKGKNLWKDTFFNFAERAKKRNWKYVEMIADHNPQWSKPAELVRLLEENK